MTPESRRDLSGTKLHGYQIIRQIGKGGMGEVYEAYEESLDRRVALKVLPAHLSEDMAFIARFLREARSAAKLEHPGICPIYAAGEIDGLNYIAMQYLDGESLGDVLEDYGSLPVEQALLVTRRVADALNFAHGKGFIHRDIKPDNIMIDREGRVKVMDFGLARRTTLDTRMTQTGMYVGTPEYSSPEQCETLDLDGRSDIYSLGVVLYEMLSGTVPHRAETPYALFKKICSEQPVPIQELSPRLPDSVAAIAGKMIAKDREERYQTAGELILAIDAALRMLNVDSTAETAAVPVPGLSSYTTEKLDERDALVTLPVTYARKRNLTPFIAVGIAIAVIGLWLVLALTWQEAGLPGGTTADFRPIEPAKEDQFREPPDADPEPVKQTIIDSHPRKPMTGPKEGLPIATLLVCDFANSNNNPEIEWMRIGVADMFVTDLAQCKFLKVVSREEFRRVLDRLGINRDEVLQNLEQVSGELSADMVLRGSVVKIGPQVRIDIHLLEAGSGEILLTQYAHEPEENFLNAVDVLSSALRTSIAGVVKQNYPEAPEKLFAGMVDLTLREQIFLADAGIDLAKSSGHGIERLKKMSRELSESVEAADKLEDSEESNPEAWEGMAGRTKEKEKPSGEAGQAGFGAREADKAVSKKDGGIDDKPGRARAEKAYSPGPPATEGAAKAKDELSRPGSPKKGAERGGDKPGAPVRRKPASGGTGKPVAAPEPDPGIEESGEEAPSEERDRKELEKSTNRETGVVTKTQENRRNRSVGKKADLSPAQSNFLAMRLYYRALARFEKKDRTADDMAGVIEDLRESIRLSPSFKPAREMLEKVEKEEGASEK